MSHETDVVGGEIVDRPVESNAIALTSWSYARTAPGAGWPDDNCWTAVGTAKTAAAALRVTDPSSDPYPTNLDDIDHWFSAATVIPTDAIERGARVLLELDGVATIAEFFWNGVAVGASETMFGEHRLDVTALSQPGENRLTVHCQSLTSWLAARKVPRARWKTRVVEEQKLRSVRTTLLGRATGWSPPTTVIGLWRDARVTVVDGPRLATPRVRARTLPRGEGIHGLIDWSIEFTGGADEHPVSVDTRVVRHRSSPGRSADPSTIETVGAPFSVSPVESSEGPLTAEEMSAPSAQGGGEPVRVSGTIEVSNPDLWWPHTHGEPALYDVFVSVRLSTGSVLTTSLGTCGFRTLATDNGADGLGFGLVMNGLPVFARWCVVPARPDHVRRRFRTASFPVAYRR